MKINFCHLADYAILSRDGKLSVMGIWSGITTRKLPYVLPQAFLAFEIEMNYAELGPKLKVEIKCLDADGNPAFGFMADLNLEGMPKAKPGDRPRIGQVVVIRGLRFNRDGNYDVNIFLNENLLHQQTFEVRLLPPVPPGPQGGTPSAAS